MRKTGGRDDNLDKKKTSPPESEESSKQQSQLSHKEDSLTDETNDKNGEYEMKCRNMPIRVYLHSRQSIDRQIKHDMRSFKKTRSKSKRNVKNLDQNVHLPKKKFKQILIRSELINSKITTGLSLFQQMWIQMNLQF